MPRPRNALPSYRRHKQSGQAVVTVRGADGRRRDVLLGKYNSPESKAEYERLLAELRVSPTASPSLPAGRHDLTVAELALAYLKHATAYYVGPDGKPTSTMTEIRLVLKPLRQLYGHTPAREFGPLALKAVRQAFADSGLGRKEVNRRAGRVKRVFKWGVAEELVPAVVYQALAAVEGIRKGRSDLPEPPPVRPVDGEDVRATLPYLPPLVAAMVEVQLLTGMRPGEVCRLRPADLDRAGPVWVYRPGHHKTAYAGRDRAVAIGPKAQAILAPLLPADPTAYVFSPGWSEVARNAARSENRVTPRWPSHMARNERKRGKVRPRPIGTRYTTQSYHRAVVRGVEKANADRARHDVPDGPNLPPVAHWYPHRLRHSHATEVRRRFGLEGAQVALGHSRADVTQVYAARDLGLATRVALELG